MSKQRRSFSTEFKREAAAARNAAESVLRRGVLQPAEERGGVTPQSKALEGGV